MNPVKLAIALVAVFALSVGASTAHAAGCFGPDDKKGEKPSPPKCPVMGESIDFSVKTDTKDGPVYFCCKDCIKKFKANPEKYAKKVAEQRKAVAAMPKAQVTCPVTGKPIDKKVFIEHNGEKVYFCCPDCAPKFKKDPKKYAAKLADSYTYQTKCPVMGGDIDPTTFTTLPDGRKVFYCCAGCDKPFLKDPAKYAAKLEAQGMKIDPEKIKAGGKKKDEHAGHDSHKGHGDHAGHDH